MSHEKPVCRSRSNSQNPTWNHRLVQNWERSTSRLCIVTLIIELTCRIDSDSEVAQSCPTLCNPMDCSLPGSSIHGIFQARVLEWVAISFSRRSSWPRDWTRVSYIVGRCFTVWATREYIMWNAGLDESQAGIKIAWRNINSLRYADYTTLVPESKEELKSLLMRVKEESKKAGLKFNIQKC